VIDEPRAGISGARFDILTLERESAMNESPSWLMLAAPFGLVLYLTLLLGFFWVAVRVVRHAWYWGSSLQKALGRTPLDMSDPHA
jgi:hypothetical protein